MKIVHITHPDTPPIDDPQVQTAMGVWDNLTPDEQRELFRTLYRAVAAHHRTSDVDHLVRFAESVDGMVRIESATDLRHVLRDRRKVVPEPADVDFADIARRLEE